MATDPSLYRGSREAVYGGSRRDILREVYEENLRVRDRAEKVRIPDRTPRRRDTEEDGPDATANQSPHVRWKFLVVLAGLFFVVAGVVAQLSDTEADPLTANSDDLTTLRTGTPAAMLTAPAMVPRRTLAALPVDRPSVSDLYGLQLKTIVIDAGHGGRDPGAVGDKGLTEKEVTLDVALRLKARLEQYPEYHVMLTREEDASMSLRERINFANEYGADLFVSIHINWIPDKSVAPIETFFYGPNSDSRIVQLAQQENKNSGFSHADFDDLTRQLGMELKIEESSKVARSIQDGLYRNMRRINDQVSDWGAKSGDFMVLLGVRAPSVLAEIGSISNNAEELNLNTPAYREKLAFFLEEGLVNYLREHDHDDERTEYVGQESKEGI